jgi:hypothetical protein
VNHFFAAAIYATAWAVVLFTSFGERDAVPIALLVAASLAAGLLSGSWWAIALCVFVPALVATDPCEPTAATRCEVNGILLALVFWAPASAAVIACGVGLRTLGHKLPP